MQPIVPPSSWYQASKIAAWIFAGVMLVAGIGKFIDLSVFRTSLDTWVLLPETAKALLTLAVPLLEVILGLIIILSASKPAYIAMATMILLFTIGYIAHVVIVAPPDCNCIALLSRFNDWQSSVWKVVVRNALLLFFWICGWWSIAQSPTKSQLQEHQTAVGSTMPTRGFTIVEVLASVMVIAIIISIMLPSLAGARDLARDTHSLATVGSHAKAMAIYQTDHNDAFPAFVPRGAIAVTFIIAGQPYSINGYFGQVYTWHFGMSERYYDSQVLGPVFQRPGRDPWLVTDYRYSASFLADPVFWNERTRIGPEQWRGQHGHAVRYPSAKCLLVDDRVMDNADPRKGVIAMVDTSASARHPQDMSGPLPDGEGNWPGTWSSGRVGIHTIDGINGRDIP